VIRILVIQLRRLGDVMMTTPLLRQLRRAMPRARIDLLSEEASRPLVGLNPHLDEFIRMPAHATLVDLLDMARLLRARRYDWVIDCQGLPKTALLARSTGAPVRVGYGGRWWRRPAYTARHVAAGAEYSARDKLRLLARLLDGCAAPDLADLDLEIPVGPEVRRAGEAFCRSWFDGAPVLPPARPDGPRRWPVAALFGVSRRSYKVWPPEHLVEIGRRLERRGLRPFLVFGPGEAEAALRVAAGLGPGALVDYPVPGILVLKEILARCALFVGNDGGPKHLASASGIPAVAVFGHVHPEAWTRPDDPGQRWVATASSSRRLPTAGPCEPAATLAELPVEAVWRTLERLLADLAPLFQPGKGVV